MFIDPKTAKESLKKLRDAKGRFVSQSVSPESTTVTTAKSTGAAAITEEFLSDPNSDDPLVSFKINNPFRKILQWIKEIKKKQTTTFEFQVKVPLIALPVFLVVLGSAFTFFFNQNHQTKITPTPSTIKPTITPTPSPLYVTKIGTVKATYQVLGLMTKSYAQETSSPTSIPPTNTPAPTNTPTPTMTPTPTPPPSQYVLLDKDEHVIYLLTKKEIVLQKYLNKRVLVKGWYLAEKDTLEIKSSEDIELLP